MFYQRRNQPLTYYFFTTGLVFLIFYPFYQRWYYKKHYQKLIRNNYQSRIGLILNLTFTNEFIETNDVTGESKINLSEVDSIIETGEYFYLKMKTYGAYLIIPKSKVESNNNVRETLLELTNKLTIPFLSNLDWKWK